MSVTREAVEEAKALVAPHIVGAKHVRIRVVTLRRLLTALQAREEENEKLRSQRDALRQQSEVWALEARAHKSSLHEAYQAITGATGEPGNWNGAKPIIEHVTTLQSALAEALGALKGARAIVAEELDCLIRSCSLDGTAATLDAAARDEVASVQASLDKIDAALALTGAHT